jgi:acyl carrier protein
MELKDIDAKLMDILRDVLDDDTLQIAPELKASDVAGWDSLNHIRIILTVEKVFGIKFSPAEIAKLKDVGELERLIESKV